MLRLDYFHSLPEDIGPTVGLFWRRAMRFTLIDRIVDLQPGRSITAVKSLSLAEEYLEDHFPLFPVMPGVLMLEAMTQTCAWLIRVGEDFCHSHVVLREARNVKYADFVEPGQTLTITADLVEQEERFTRLRVKGLVEGKSAVVARLVMTRYNLADDNPERASLDKYTIRHLL